MKHDTLLVSIALDLLAFTGMLTETLESIRVTLSLSPSCSQLGDETTGQRRTRPFAWKFPFPVARRLNTRWASRKLGGHN